MTHGSCAWTMTDNVRKMVNGVNSKMLSLITKQTIHQEARDPTYDVIEHIMQQRWQYLGHVLRMDSSRTLKRFLLELSPCGSLYRRGSLLDDTNFVNVETMMEVAADRRQWQVAWKTRRRDMQM